MASLPHGKHDPRRVSVETLAALEQVLDGRTPLAEFPRLLDATDDPTHEIAWRVQATKRERAGAEALLRLHLSARATVMLCCQRCLEPIPITLQVDRWLRFVRGEGEAARLDAESEDDVLALEPHLDLLALVEDELLLDLPLVPRHERCVDLAALGDGPADEPVRDGDNPFGVLAALKGKAH